MRIHPSIVILLMVTLPSFSYHLHFGYFLENSTPSTKIPVPTPKYPTPRKNTQSRIKRQDEDVDSDSEDYDYDYDVYGDKPLLKSLFSGNENYFPEDKPLALALYNKIAEFTRELRHFTTDTGFDIQMFNSRYNPLKMRFVHMRIQARALTEEGNFYNFELFDQWARTSYLFGMMEHYLRFEHKLRMQEGNLPTNRADQDSARDSEVAKILLDLTSLKIAILALYGEDGLPETKLPGFSARVFSLYGCFQELVVMLDTFKETEAESVILDIEVAKLKFTFAAFLNLATDLDASTETHIVEVG
ncbi:hypothetical protein JCM33374_g1795 [Metschnikowia sp. JCM 33374]|nr:hypothetical protein JCM33374_g1795 [Metschnikowia sp. JCM 33374]